MINKGSPVDGGRIRLTKTIGIILFCVASPYIIIFQFSGKPILGWLVVPIVSAFLASVWCVRLQKYTLAKFLLILPANIGAGFYAASFGKEAGIQLLYFAFIGFSVVIFDPKEKIKIFLATLVTVACVFTLEITHYTIFPLTPTSPEYKQIIHWTAVSAVLLMIFLYIRFYALSNEQLLQNEHILRLDAEEKNLKLEQSEQEKEAAFQRERELRLKSEEQTTQLAEKDTLNQVLIKQVSNHLDTSQLLVSTLQKSEAALEVALEETQKEKQEKEAAFQREHALRMQWEDQAAQLDAANAILKRQKKAMHLTEAGKIVQEKMLCLSEPVDYLAVSVAYRAALGVSGDYYATYQITPYLLGIIVADVTGKGVPAALNMTLLYRILRKIFRENTPEFLANPKAVTKALEAALFAEPAFEKCLSFTYIVIDTRTKMMRYVIAGSESMVIVSREDGAVQALTSNNIALRLEENNDFEEGSLQLHSKSRVFIVTDGYLEFNRSTGKKIITSNDNGTYNFSLFHEMNNSYAPSPELSLAQHSFNWWHSHIMDNSDELPDDTTVVAVEIA
jgi:serine phosphatase RsbU (regulator of sigma subunit)